MKQIELTDDEIRLLIMSLGSNTRAIMTEQMMMCSFGFPLGDDEDIEAVNKSMLKMVEPTVRRNNDLVIKLRNLLHSRSCK